MDKATADRLKKEGKYWCPHFYWTRTLDANLVFTGGYYTTLENSDRVTWAYCPTCGKKRPDHVA